MLFQLNSRGYLILNRCATITLNDFGLLRVDHMWRQSLSDDALHESVSHKVNSNGKHVVTPESWLTQNLLALQIKALRSFEEIDWRWGSLSLRFWSSFSRRHIKHKTETQKRRKQTPGRTSKNHTSFRWTTIKIHYRSALWWSWPVSAENREF